MELFRNPASANPSAPRKQFMPGRLRKPKVLFVDDDATIRTLFREILQMDGLDVTLADSARSAKSLLERAPFDVVITDLRMESETAGFDVLRFARSLAVIPFLVLLTAYPVPREVWKHAGADMMLTKGFSVQREIRLLHDVVAARAAS